MGVRGGGHIRAGRVNMPMDREGGDIHDSLSFDHIPHAVDPDEIGRPDLAEIHAEWINPECLRINRIAHRDVPGDAFAEAQGGEYSKPAGEAFLTVALLIGETGENGY